MTIEHAERIEKEQKNAQAIKLSGPAFDNFVEVIKSPETRSTYELRLRQYMEYRKVC